MDITFLKSLIFICGVGHVILSIASLSIPKVLKWNFHLKDLHPLLRQMFWTYAAYILVINLSFGIISLIGTNELVNRSLLAKAVTFFISIYWLARIGIQFFYFDKSSAPAGAIFKIGEIALLTLFAAFTLVYLMAFLYNNSWI